MAAFDFPPTPAVGTLYPLVAEVGKPQYRWNGNEWTAATFDPAGYVRKSGDAMTGALSLAGDPTQALHAVPKQYIDHSVITATPNSSSVLDVVIPPAYPSFQLRIEDLMLASAGQISARVSVNNGVSYDGGAGDYWCQFQIYGATQSFIQQSNGGPGLTNAVGVGNAAIGINGIIEIMPGGGGVYCSTFFSCMSFTEADNLGLGTRVVQFKRITSTRITNLRLQSSGPNISRGTLRLISFR